MEEERVRQLVVAYVGGFFQDKAKTRLWLKTPNALLGGLSPNQMIGAGRAEALLRFIETAIAENTR